MSALVLEANEHSTLRLTGGVAFEGSSIQKRGGGSVVLASEVSSLTGDVNVEAGELRLERSQVLANAATTVMPGATLSVVSPFDTPEHNYSRYALPQLTLDGGVLRAALATDPTGYVHVDTNITLLSDSTIESADKYDLTVFGTISGPGGLTFRHSGEVRPPSFPSYPPYRPVTYIDVVGDATYSGETVIGPGVSVTFASGSLPGDAIGGTHVLRGSLYLRGGGGAERIDVENGSIDLEEAESAYGHTVTLRSGQLSGGAPGFPDPPMPAVLATDVHYRDGAAFGGSSSSDYLVLLGGVEGTGSVAIRNAVDFMGGLTARGNIYVRDRAVGELSGPLSLAGEVFFDGSTLRISSETQLSDTRFRLAPTFGGAPTRLTIAGNNSLGEVVIDPRYDRRGDVFEHTVLEVEEGYTLTLDAGLRFMGGKLSGRFEGQPTIVKQGLASGWLEGHATSSFDRVDVEAGLLVVQGDAGLTPADIHLMPHDTSRLELVDTGAYDGAVYLNSSQGRRGATISLGEGVLYDGDLFLGSGTATIEAGSDDLDVGLGSNASIHGGDVLLDARSRSLRLRSGSHTYSGSTEIAGRDVVLVDSGRLNSTAAVVGSTRSRLTLDNSGVASHPDRIPDATPVHMNGMTLLLGGRGGESVSETLGDVRISKGTGVIEVENPYSDGSATVLNIRSLTRMAGGAVRFSRSNGAQILLDGTPDLNDGLIGGWAMSDGEFATYGPTGVAPYGEVHSYATDIASATEVDNVRQVQSAVLIRDTVVNSLSALSGEIDLGGHRLTIESGGLISHRRVYGAGEITTGGESGGELVVSGNARIEVNIVDGPSLPVGVTAMWGDVILSGVNTYTGPTVVNNEARMFLRSETALPGGGDLVINGGTMLLESNSEAGFEIGHVQIRGSGALRTDTGYHPRIIPARMTLESGSIGWDVDIVGDAPITKIGAGSASLTDNLRLHSGSITIEQGSLSVYGSPDPVSAGASGPITIESGGLFEVRTSSSLSDRPLRFDGGILFLENGGEVAADIEVLQGGGTIRNELGATEVSSRFTGDGVLVVEGGFGHDARFVLNSDLSNWAGQLRLAGGPIHLGEHFSYEKPLQINASTLTTSGGAPFGEALVSVMPETELSVSNTLHANLELSGGVLRMWDDEPVLDGSLTVNGHSYLYLESLLGVTDTRPAITGKLNLAQDAHLVVAATPDGPAAASEGLFSRRLSIESDISVYGTATLTAFDSVVEMSGQLSAATTDAELRLVGNDTFEFRGSIHLENGYTLTLIEDGDRASIALSGSASSLTGDGTLVADLTLSEDASISPGSSTGNLSVEGSLTLNSNAVYEWELDAAASDSIIVDGSLSFGAVATLQVVQLGGAPRAADEFVLFEYDALQADPINPDWTIDGARAPDWDFSSASVLIDPDANQVLLTGVATVLNPADFNNDGLVDAADYTVWRDSLDQMVAPFTSADADGDGHVTHADYRIWAANYGAIGGPSSALSAPEPCVFCLLGVTLLASSVHRPSRDG